MSLFSRRRSSKGAASNYPLGIIFYQMLAGQPPFSGQGVGVVAMHLVEEPPPLRDFAPRASDTVVQLIGAMLQKKRQARPTMEEVAATLRRPVLNELYQSSANISAASLQASLQAADAMGPLHQPSTLGRLAGQQISQARRPPLRLFALAGVVVLLGGGAVAALLRTKQTPAVTAAAVRWSVVTEPPGATVSQVTDGKVLGTTPWSKAEPSGLGAVRVRLSMDGYRPAELSLDRKNDTSLTVHLERAEPVPVHEQTASSSPAADPTSSSTAPAARPGVRKRPAKSTVPASSSSSDTPKRKTKVVDD